MAAIRVGFLTLHVYQHGVFKSGRGPLSHAPTGAIARDDTCGATCRKLEKLEKLEKLGCSGAAVVARRRRWRSVRSNAAAKCCTWQSVLGFGFSTRVLSSRGSVVASHSSLIECRESVRLFVGSNTFRRLIKTASLPLSSNFIECGTTARNFVVSNRARRTASLPASAMWGNSIEFGQPEGSRRVSSTSRRVVIFAAAPQLGGVGDSGWDLGAGDEQQLREGLKNGSGTGNGRSSRIFAKWKFWGRRKETALSKDDALPLPMTYPGSKPLPKEEVEKMAQCDPEKEDCKPVVYQWTGECRRCQGTGLVSFYRKNGREVISNCIMCLGIGYVHKCSNRDLEAEDLDQ